MRWGEGRADSGVAFVVVNDEGKCLGGCWASGIDHVDEVGVVDTGSTDRTCDIARDYGCALSFTPWEGNFAKARNVALDRATGHWCLYIDADERLVPGTVRLKDELAQPGFAAFKVPFVPRVRFTPYHEVRLFRCHDRIRFRSVIHETILPDVHAFCASQGLAIGVATNGIEHLGYEGDQSHKHDRNLPLLEAAVKVTPERVFLWTHMGETLAGLDRLDEAEAAFRTAIATAEGHPDPKEQIDGATAWLQLIRMRDWPAPTALALAKDALAAHPTHHGIQLALAVQHFANGQEDAAEVLVLGLLSVDPEQFCDPLLAYDKLLFAEWPAVLLGDIRLRRGDRAGAAEAYRSALNWAPDNVEYRAKAALCGATV